MRNAAYGWASLLVALGIVLLNVPFAKAQSSEETNTWQGPFATETLTSAPDVIVIDKMSELYMPVVFPHRQHAFMELMSNGCKQCHHHQTADKPQACSTCHGDFTEPSNLWKPGLRGAYHRQCLSCHRDWSGETSCTKCHAERVPGQPAVARPDPSDIAGRLHPNVQEPERKVYQTTPYEEGTMVTFNHKEHVQLFGKRCVDCHIEEDCGRCHNRSKDAPKHVRQDTHQDCVKCHDVTGDCADCHMKTESPGFDHAKRSGFPAKPYHEGVACQQCHTDPSTFRGLKQRCTSCHAVDWAPQGFDHAKTGKLVLDDRHRDVDCAACHSGGMGTPVNCKSCHTKAFAYPRRIPGTRLDVKSSAKPVSPP